MTASNSPESTPNSQASEHVGVAEDPVTNSARAPKTRDKPRDKQPWLLGLGALLLLGLGFGGWRWWQARQAPAAQAQAQTATVRLAAVETATVQDALEFVGNLESSRSVTLRPEIQGRVSQILVTEGSRVTAGTALVQLEADQQTAQVAGLQAAVTAALASRNNASAQLRSARAQRGAAAAEVELQQEQYRRTAGLVETGALARQELDLVERDRAAAISQLNAIDEEIRAAQATVAEAEAAVQQAQANVASASSDLGNTTVTAPLTGIVGNIPVRIGDVVSPTSTITTITQSDSLELNLNIPAERRGQLRTGLEVELRDIQGNPLTTGRISFVAPQVENGAQSILAKATFANPTGQLRDGLNVRGRVIWSERPGLLIPTAAVTRQAGQTFVYVAEPPLAGEQAPAGEQVPAGEQAGLVARQVPIQVGTIQDNRYPVLEGLQAGQQVVVSGVQNLANGAPIQPLAAGSDSSDPNSPGSNSTSPSL
jgi:RND family efflux transporter MFP subunit